MDYHWYPGHMTKAVRQMKEDIKLIDLVIELLDARIPLSSRNPDIDDLGKNKARLVLWLMKQTTISGFSILKIKELLL